MWWRCFCYACVGLFAATAMIGLAHAVRANDLMPVVFVTVPALFMVPFMWAAREL